MYGEGGGPRAMKGKGEGVVGSWWRMERIPCSVMVVLEVTTRSSYHYMDE